MITGLSGRWSLIAGVAILFSVLMAGCVSPLQGPAPAPTQVTPAPAHVSTTSATTVMTAAPMPAVTTMTTTVMTTVPAPTVTASATAVMTTVPTPQMTTTPANQTTVSPTFTIAIQSFAFNPQTATVPNGTTVTWTNQESATTQIINAPNGMFAQGYMFKSSPLEMGQSYSFTFNASGTFQYFDSLHPAITGKVIVMPGMTTAPTPQVTTTPANQTNASSSFTITIQSFAFNPQTATVLNGTTVTWTNQESATTQIINAPNAMFNQGYMFNSGPLEMGQNYSFTFNASGTFQYFDSLHPAVTGKIIVT